MAKTILGVDVGREQLKLALVRNGHVLKTASAPMPENLLQEGRIVSRESMSDLIKKTMKENGLRASYAAFVVPNEAVFVKNVEMPLMTIEQLKFNLPFEFNDYITGEVRDYVFDYAVLKNPAAEEKKQEKQKKEKKQEKQKKEKKPKKEKKGKKKADLEQKEVEQAVPSFEDTDAVPSFYGQESYGTFSDHEGVNPAFESFAAGMPGGSFSYGGSSDFSGGSSDFSGANPAFENLANSSFAAVENHHEDTAFAGNSSTDTAKTDEEDKGKDSMELTVVAAMRSVLEDAQEILRQAGLKLLIAAPPISTYISLIRLQRQALSQVAEEYGILDLGYNAIRMYMFLGDRLQATRILEIGLSSVDSVISEIFSVDVHLAHTYLMTNYENCQERAECLVAYENIAVELMRALNFYRFSNPDSNLSDLWVCGGGAEIPMLTTTIGEILDKQLHRAEELVLEGERVEHCNSFIQAIGITLG